MSNKKTRVKRAQSWHLFWRVPDKTTLRDLELFVRLSVVRGIHHTAVLTELVRKYNREFIASNPEVRGITLADEKALMKRLRGSRTPVSRVLLSNYRANSRLVSRDGGPPLYWTDGRRVVYNLEGCKAFFRDRAA